MPSADLDRAAQIAVTARVQNNGQSCIAAKRFIVHSAVYDAFAERFVARMRELKVGDPFASDTDVGPLATEQGRTDVEKLVDDAVSRGATVLCGGQRPDGPGWFYPPTVITDITEDMPLYQEEVFGPVASLYRVETSRRPSRCRTPPRSGSVRTPGPVTRRSSGGSSPSWRPDRCSSTAWWCPSPSYHSVGPALGLRPGAVRARHPRVLQPQDGLGRRLRQQAAAPDGDPHRAATQSGSIINKPGCVAARRDAG